MIVYTQMYTRYKAKHQCNTLGIRGFTVRRRNPWATIERRCCARFYKTKEGWETA